MPLPPGSLADPAFLTGLKHLCLRARRVPRGGRFAEQRSRAPGSGIEFQDHRAYVPGDDLRALDWNLWRRHGGLFIRLFEELEDLPVYLLPDLSRSMWIEDPPRVRAALRAALGFAAVALEQQDRVAVLALGEELVTLQRPFSGPGRILELARRLEAVEPQDGTDLAACLERFAAMRRRRGLAVVLSDFFDPQGLEPVTEALGRLRHRLLLVPVTRAADREPVLEGDLRLVDCETGEEREISPGPEVLAAYRRAYGRFWSGLEDFARRRQAGFLPVDADQPVLPRLAAFLGGGGFAA